VSNSIANSFGADRARIGLMSHLFNKQYVLGLAVLLMAAALPLQASPITTDLTSSKDSYIQSGSPATNYGAQATAQIKRDDDSNFTRKSYFGFDLSGLPTGTIIDAALSFEFVTGLGNTGETTQWTFELYGLTAQNLDGWDETTITWNNAPANNTALSNSPSQVILSETTSLATFTRFGAGVGVQSIPADPDLLNFLLSDTNDLVSFILVRTTDAPAGQNYVHSIATKENTSQVLRPTLSVTVDSAQPVPAPGTLALLALGIAGLQARKRFSSTAHRP
jgi:hypothetical protein